MKSLTLFAVLTIVVLGCSSGGTSGTDTPLDAFEEETKDFQSSVEVETAEESEPSNLETLNEPETPSSMSATIGPEGGEYALTEPGHPLTGLRLVVPPEALSVPTEITFALSSVDWSQHEGIEVDGPAVDIGPSGTRFQYPAVLYLPTNHTGATSVFVVSEGEGGRLEIVDTVAWDDEEHIVGALVNHLSPFAAATASASQPEYAVPGFAVGTNGLRFGNIAYGGHDEGMCVAYAMLAKWLNTKGIESPYRMFCRDVGGPALESGTGAIAAQAVSECGPGVELVEKVYSKYLSDWVKVLATPYALVTSLAPSALRLKLLKTKMKLTGEPQVVSLVQDNLLAGAIKGVFGNGFQSAYALVTGTDMGDEYKNPAHAVLAYAYDDSSLWIYDSNKPGKENVRITHGALLMDKYDGVFDAAYSFPWAYDWTIDIDTMYAEFHEAYCTDADGDGGVSHYCAGNDCDDTKHEVCEGFGEACNGLDDNCDGRTDEEGALGCTPYYVDGDNDGFGAGDPRCLCAPEAPYTVGEDGDCRDDKAKVHPGADELCDGLDNDCNSQTDEGGVCVEPCVDNDGDGYGVGPGCSGPRDCDDTKAKVYPNAPEKCDGLDNDCDTQTDEDDVCGEPPFENPDDTETSDVQVTVTQVETSPGSKQIKLFAKVETQQGKPLQQLTIGNFVLRETVGGATQTLPIDSLFATKETTESMSAGLLIDSSGSMGSGDGSPLAQAKIAAKLFVTKLKPQDTAAVIDFGSEVHVNADFTNDKQALFGAIDACSDGGMTSMYDALDTGITMIAGRPGQRALVLLSDGGDNDSACTPCTPNNAVAPAVAAGVPIFTIGLGASPGSGLESDLIAVSNGTFAGQNGSAYYSTVDPLGLQAIYDAIVTVLRNMYVIGWYTQGNSGQTVDVTITVTYTCAGGTFTDTFMTSYVVP
jgi:Mg-chelatase subunit ChlD